MFERLWPCVVGLLLGCSESGPPLRLDQPGDPCRSPHDVCLDDDLVLSCAAEVWVERDCASVCADRGPAYGPAGCDRECVCELLDPTGCTPEEATCVDGDTVAVCDEAQELQSIPCSEVCADAGLNEVGCLDVEGEAACWCTSEATACEPATEPSCVGNETIASCEAGAWVFAECEAICGAPAACDPFRRPAACDC